MSPRPAATGARSDSRVRRLPTARAFTLVELLIGLVLGAITLGAAVTILVSYIRTSDNALWQGQAEQDFGRISRFIKTEINEACLVQVSASPSTTATLPSTPCTPPSATPCTTTSGTTLFLLIPITAANGSVTYRVISYTRNGTELRRTGPPITSTGSLGTGTDVANVVLMDNLTNTSAGFAPTVRDDCTSATMSFSFAIPNSTSSLPKTLTVSVGSPFMLN